MYKIFSSYRLVGAIALLLLFVPKNIFAAELTFKIIPSMSTGGETTIVEVRINPESKILNVVEGTINFSGTASDNLSVQIENGQSVLPIWPTPPQYNKEKKTIIFTGGVPNGFNFEGLLFRLLISPATYGDLNISYENGNAYLNDGKGTKEIVFSKPLKIHTEKDENNKTIKVSSSFNKMKYVTIILLIVVLFIIFKYAHKKVFKK